MKRIAVKTIGCKLNQYDSQSIAEPFLENGFVWVDFDESADVYIINTCTVTGRADYSSRQAVSRALKSCISGKSTVVVTGCYAEVNRTVFENFDGVDIVVGNDQKSNLYDIVSHYINSGLLDNNPEEMSDSQRHWGRAITTMRGYSRAFIKIQDGCNANCTYCIVPKARGNEISRAPEEIAAEIERLTQAGYNEVVLTGVHIGRYNYRGMKFHQLLSELFSKDGPRIRFSSIEPIEVTGELIDVIADNNMFCRHMHIPVQSGSDRILQQMKRNYKSDFIREICYKLKQSIPGITIGADFIAGYPGENDDDFDKSCRLASDCGFGYLHVFSYSDRPGTVASSMTDKISPVLISKRSNELIGLSEKLISQNLTSNIN
ncbi:MAG: tRNA (N(6)-L-threonylcarbamoyladenosine(37)-C(2))-methylthiotransferase MtaB, partial [candidate division Zixibacteria bacterium]|nr:tRNA (N(6)-L-threonylcarbamoyladenosine(37)-C(2))-methylthiotransferase MtaB [candidate division Zixibacteria bacterium]